MYYVFYKDFIGYMYCVRESKNSICYEFPNGIDVLIQFMPDNKYKYRIRLYGEYTGSDFTEINTDSVTRVNDVLTDAMES